MVRLTISLLLLSLSACEAPEPPGRGDDTGDVGDGVGGGGSGEADADTDADSDADTDADITPDVDGDMCEEVAGYDNIPGAANYYYGALSRSGEEWSGAESWRLFANSDWEKAGGADCEVVWRMTGETVDDGGECATCEFSVSLSATVDTGRTDCDPDIYAGSETFTITYAVDDHGDGTHGIFFAGSGRALGTGEIDGDELTYVTEPNCLWF